MFPKSIYITLFSPSPFPLNLSVSKFPTPPHLSYTHIYIYIHLTNYKVEFYFEIIFHINMSRTLEITILSAENLQMNRKSIKKDAFVTVQSDASSDVCSTKVDSEGGSYPSWNEKIVIDVPLHARFVTVEVKCKTSSTGIKSVGMARIPVSDFIGGYVPEDQLHFLSYRLWDSKVRKNGLINISVRVKVPEHSCSNSMPLPVKGVPVVGNGSTAVVTGIPAVWLNYQKNL